MPAADLEDLLSASRPVVLILRLVLDRRGRIRYGELLDARTTLLDCFVGERELRQTLRHWCSHQREAAKTDGAPGRDHLP
jgi:hypothetical protein